MIKFPKAPFLQRILLIPFHIKSGIRYHIPVCCIIRFIWDNILGYQSAILRKAQYRPELYFEYKDGCWISDYVPCMIFHSFEDAGLKFFKIDEGVDK